MTEIVENQETILLANGNIKKVMKKNNSDSTPNNKMLVTPSVSKPSAMEEERIREKQFCDMIMHVIDRIEKESEEDPVDNEELMSEASLWDLKSYLKSSVGVSGVSETSPIVILETVNSKLATMFHEYNLFHIGRLAACTKVEADFIAARAATTLTTTKNNNNVAPCDVLLAIEDAKSVVKILNAVHNKGDGKEDTKKDSKNPWNLSQMTNLLHIKNSSKKFMGQLSPKSIRSSIVDVFVGQSSREDEDIDSFQAI